MSQFVSTVAAQRWLTPYIFHDCSGHCMELQPEYDKAAAELFADGFPRVLAKVDGTDAQNQKLMQMFGIRAYPTLVVLLEGIHVDIYSEGHAAGAIASYMRQFLAPPPDYYSTLGLARDAREKEIKKAYRELSKSLHPDRAANGGDPERFALVTKAYETLSNADERSMYDAFGGIKFHQKGMQRNYMQQKGIKLKLYQEEDSAVQTLDSRKFHARDRAKVSDLMGCTVLASIADVNYGVSFVVGLDCRLLCSVVWPLPRIATRFSQSRSSA